jgi:internalin A
MRHAANFQQLKFLKVTNTKIGDAGVREIAKLKNLENLQASGLLMNGPKMDEPTESSLMQLGQLQNLKTLDLSTTNVGDNCVKAFANLGQLRTLTLNATRITDAGALNFAKLQQLEVQQLEDLVLGRTVSFKTVNELRKMMPKTRISQR